MKTIEEQIKEFYEQGKVTTCDIGARSTVCYDYSKGIIGHFARIKMEREDPKPVRYLTKRKRTQL